MSKSRKSGPTIPKSTKPGPLVETRGRKRKSADGSVLDQKITTLVTVAEKRAWLSQVGTKSQAESRRALHGICPMISMT